MMSDDELRLTFRGQLLILVESAPRCKCGGDCETLQYLTDKVTQQ